jgi:Fe-S-cluster containining protein
MPITAVEASRLTRRTGMAEDQFCSKDENGIRRLLNNQDTRACVFLATSSDLPSAPGICSVYDSRPLGCKTYPVILNEEDLAILDDLCPYTESFDEPGEDEVHILLNLEEKLKR